MSRARMTAAQALGGYAFALALAASGAVVFIAGVLVGSSASGFGVEAAKGLLTLGTGLVLGGAVKVLVDHVQETAKQREDHREMRERLLADLRLVHDRSENARLLIAAHRSAKTYGEQMRGLIACEVVLLKVKRTLDLAPSERHEEESRCLADMLGYLRALSDEYRAEYKKVADCQRYDEALTTARFKAAADAEVSALRGTGAGPGQAPSASDTAWDMLRDRRLFPVLDDLSGRGDQYRTYFQRPLNALAADLLNAGGEVRSDDPFEQAVTEVAREVENACTTLRTEAPQSPRTASH